MTKNIGAKVLGLPMELHPEIIESIAQWVEAHHPGRGLTESQKRQALIPKGATVFANGAGTAPGAAIQHHGKVLIHLPGPPMEMRWMYTHRLRPWLLQTFGSQGYIKSLYMKIYDMGEAFIEEKANGFGAAPDQSDDCDVCPSWFCRSPLDGKRGR